MINSTPDCVAAAARGRWLRQALTVASAALAIVVSRLAGIPAVRAAEEVYPVGCDDLPLPPSAPHMTARREGARPDRVHAPRRGEREDRPGAAQSAFIEAQNAGATTGIAIGQTAPSFELRDQSGRTHTLKSLMGRKGVAAGFYPQRRLVTLLPGAGSSSCSIRPARSQRAAPGTGVDQLRFCPRVRLTRFARAHQINPSRCSPTRAVQ